MLENLDLPSGVTLVRETAEFTADTAPPGLLRAHRIAAGVWGRLRVLEGAVEFVREDDSETRMLLAHETQVIEPEVAHHVEPSTDARFLVEFYR